MSDGQQEPWGPEVVTEMLRRQVAELEKSRGRLLLRGQNPHDEDALRDAMHEIQAFRKTLFDIENELKSECDKSP